MNDRPLDAAPTDLLADLWTTDRARQNAAFHGVMAATESTVPWAYEVWDDLLEKLTHPDNHHRAIAAQVLCNLAKSDPDDRMSHTLDALMTVTHDARFVTARHCLQSLWKVGTVGYRQRERLLSALRDRFAAAADEKNGTLVRYDITVVLRKVYDAVGDEDVKAASEAWIDAEADPKYRKKYEKVWRSSAPA
jgi:hypothetical protein